MNRVLDAFWRALAYCLHPRVILWSLLPLALAGGTVLGLGWFLWVDAIDAVRAALEQWSLVATLLAWLESIGAGAFRSAIAPLIVVALALPAIVVLSLLLVASLMTPALVALVVARRFPALERRGGSAAWWRGLAWSLGCSLAALATLVVTLPLWFVPPLALLLPALIWGWLAARVLAFDVLVLQADPGERRLLMHSLRWPLLGMGIAAGMLGSVPSIALALAGVLGVIFAPLLVVAAIWLYTLVFAFATLWVAHFTLERLQALRQAAPASVVVDTAAPRPRPALPAT